MRYTVRAAARATGVSEGRLRTWERRYGIPKPLRSDTNRRLYEDADLALIRRMAALTDMGISAAEAAAAVLVESDGDAIPDAPTAAPTTTSIHPLVEAMVQATLALDEPGVRSAFVSGLTELGWPGVYDDLIFPTLRAVGDAWERSEIQPAHEHFLSELLRRFVLAALDAEPLPADGAPQLVLACPPAERHVIGMLGLHLMLQRLGVCVVYLGSDVPNQALLTTVAQLEPAAVCLVATASTSRAEVAIAARAVATSRVAPRVFVGGPALESRGSAEIVGVHLPALLGDAAQTIANELLRG